MPHFQGSPTTPLDPGSSSCGAFPLPRDGEIEPSCPSVLQFTWGEQTHLAPWSNLEPHGAWSILEHPSGAPQGLEHP